MTDSRQERIRKRAYELWQTEGCPPGKEVEHWFRAEAEIAALEDTVFPTLDDPAARSAPDPDDTDNAPVMGEETPDEAAKAGPERPPAPGLAEEPTPFTPSKAEPAPEREQPPAPGAGPGEAKAGKAGRPDNTDGPTSLAARVSAAADKVAGALKARPKVEPEKDKPAAKTGKGKR
ncbi:DUF2934 domain-containing protein [Marinivivus vitaminiproducens]|uniref:DUF2934 domain-containing protein n=1 Tax=Marinivivus vitaminiproducens TaxID=3035935 RepID=UPI00279EA915|nr:DUF2934 domain-containing protein [Geminicoccaceae bacterium SCSIO 64248]